MTAKIAATAAPVIRKNDFERSRTTLEMITTMMREMIVAMAMMLAFLSSIKQTSSLKFLERIKNVFCYDDEIGLFEC